MIVNLTRRAGEDGPGDIVAPERLDGDFLFEGGEAQEGVLVTFHREGREITGRVISVSLIPNDLDAGPVVEIELIDEAEHDVDSEVTLANLPPGDDTDTEI